MIIIVLLLIAISAIIGIVHIKKHALILGMVATISLLIACLLGSLIYITRYKINIVDTSTSPDGTYELFSNRLEIRTFHLDIHV